MPLAARLAFLVYDAVLLLGWPLVRLRLWRRGRAAPAYRERIGERFARYAAGAPAGPVPVWVHAVSAGETIAAAPLVERLLERYGAGGVLVTTMTPTGSAEVRRRFGERVRHVYLPYDRVDPMRRFLRRFRPGAGLLIETELWPNLLRVARSEGVPVALVNARLSHRSYRGYFALRFWVAPLLGGLSRVLAQYPAHGARFLALGVPAPRIVVTGSLKFDLRIPPDLPERIRRCRALRDRACTAPPSFTWIAASTHPGEEEAALEAHAVLRRAVPDASLVLVPRHPERFDAAAACIEAAGQPFRRVTAPEGADPGSGGAPGAAVILVDRMGELFEWFGAADVAFVGGSLGDRGGHNVIEPAWHGLPVLLGPSDHNFREVVAAYQGEGVLERVRSGPELGAALTALARDPAARRTRGDRARTVTLAGQGVLERTEAALAAVLPETRSAPPVP
jgi:3-deoxy-D-manno-octulosonic-acid transferase